MSEKSEADVHTLAEHGSQADGGALLAELAAELAGANVAAVHALLAAALNADGALQRCGSPAAPNEGAAMQRLHLLHLSDLVDTFVAMHGQTAEVRALRDFVAAGLPAAAAALAAAGAVSPLATLLQRHPYGVGRAALPALAALPAATPITQYLPVLQRMLSAEASRASAAADQLNAHADTHTNHRAADPVEHPEFLAAMPQAAAAAVSAGGPERALASAASHFAPSAEEIDAWVLERAAAIDDDAGLANLSLAILKAWAAAGRSAATAPAAALHMWLSVLRHCSAIDSSSRDAFTDMGVRTYLDMTPPAQLRAVLIATLSEGLPIEQAADVVTEVPCLVLQGNVCVLHAEADDRRHNAMLTENAIFCAKLAHDVERLKNAQPAAGAGSCGQCAA